jgi:hypothetical protein
VYRGRTRRHFLRLAGSLIIVAFYLPGDIFGVEADDLHRFTAEAIIDSKIWIAKRNRMFAALDDNLANTKNAFELLHENLQPPTKRKPQPGGIPAGASIEASAVCLVLGASRYNSDLPVGRHCPNLSQPQADKCRNILRQSSSSDCARRRSMTSLISWSTKVARAPMRCLCSGLSVL